MKVFWAVRSRGIGISSDTLTTTDHGADWADAVRTAARVGLNHVYRVTILDHGDRSRPMEVWEKYNTADVWAECG